MKILTSLMESPSIEDDIGLADYYPPFPAARDDVKCGECGAPMAIRESKGRPFYGCTRWPTCTGTHSAHPDGRPQGIPADKATRKARTDAHRFFDLLWKPGEHGQKPKMTRAKAYAWLRKHMQLSESEAHFSRFDQAQCEKAVTLIKRAYPEVRSIWDKLADDDIFG